MDKRGPGHLCPRSKCPSGHRYQKCQGAATELLWQVTHVPDGCSWFLLSLASKSTLSLDAQFLGQVLGVSPNKYFQSPSLVSEGTTVGSNPMVLLERNLARKRWILLKGHGQWPFRVPPHSFHHSRSTDLPLTLPLLHTSSEPLKWFSYGE